MVSKLKVKRVGITSVFKKLNKKYVRQSKQEPNFNDLNEKHREVRKSSEISIIPIASDIEMIMSEGELTFFPSQENSVEMVQNLNDSSSASASTGIFSFFYPHSEITTTELVKKERSFCSISESEVMMLERKRSIAEKSDDETESLSSDEEVEQKGQPLLFIHNAVDDFESVSSEDIAEVAKRNFSSDVALGFATLLKILATNLSSISAVIEDRILIDNAACQYFDHDDVVLEWKSWVGDNDDGVEARTQVSKAIYIVETKRGNRKLVQNSNKISSMNSMKIFDSANFQNAISHYGF